MEKKKSRDITKEIIIELIREEPKEERKINNFIKVIDINRREILSIDALEEICMHPDDKIIKEPIEGRCYFLEENNAWVSRDENTRMIRYFSKNYKTNEFFYLDISDFYKITYKTSNLNKVMEKMFSDFNMIVEEEGFKMRQKEKYQDNLIFIENGYANIKLIGGYNNLWNRVENYLWVLVRLNSIGQAHIQGSSETVRRESIFSTSFSYLANPKGHDFIVRSEITARRGVNLFSLLGFIEKVRDKDLPEHVLERAMEEAKKRNVRSNNRTNIYLIKPITDELLEKAEEISRQMRKGKLKSSEVTYKNVEKVFGVEKAEELFGDTRKNTVKSLRAKETKAKEVEIDKIMIVEELVSLPY